MLDKKERIWRIVVRHDPRPLLSDIETIADRLSYYQAQRYKRMLETWALGTVSGYEIWLMPMLGPDKSLTA